MYGISVDYASGRPSIACRAPLDGRIRPRGLEDVFVTPYGRGPWVGVWVDGRIDWNALTIALLHSAP